MADEDKIIGFNDELKPMTAEELEKQYKDFTDRLNQKPMDEKAAKELTKKLNAVKKRGK